MDNLTQASKHLELSTMTQEKIESYKKKLEEERTMILEEIEETEKPVDFGSDVDGFDEETDEAEETSNQVSIANTLKIRLTEVDAALEKIRLGKYGTCELCKKEIEEAVLNVDPESRFCKSCKLLK